MKPSFIAVSWVWITLTWLHLVRAAPVSYGLSLTLASTLNNASTHDFRSPSLHAPFLSQNYSEPPIRYRVPETHTSLILSLDPSHEIQKTAMGRTILRTQMRLRDFIRRYNAEDTPLRRGEDPYESDEKYQDCFVGVATWPMGSQLLTYGMVYNALQGLWLFMYRKERYMMGVFEVRDDQFGVVGIGKIQSAWPG